MKLFSNFSDTTKYVFFIAIVAIATFFAYLAAVSVLQTSESSAAIINTAGRQRMYSQRVASFAAEYALGIQSARFNLIEATTRFESNTKALQEKMEARQHSLLFSSNLPKYDDSLNKKITAYLTGAKRISQLAVDDPSFSPELQALLNEAREPILKALDQLVVSEQRFAEDELSRIASLQKVLFLFIVLMLIFGVFVIFRPMVKNVSHLEHLNAIDALTGAYSRRMFLDRANTEFSYAESNHKALSLLMIDVDHFKKINDVFGHAGGDTALQSLVTHIAHLLHSSDFIGRLGGEEFAVILPETPLEEASAVAERIRVSVDNLIVPYGNRYIKLSVSVGVASISAHLNSLGSLLKDADAALYDAKSSGRNKIATNKIAVVN